VEVSTEFNKYELIEALLNLKIGQETVLPGGAIKRLDTNTVQVSFSANVVVDVDPSSLR
jgi:hypothetical protein